MTFLRGIPIDIGAHIVDLLAGDGSGREMEHVKTCALVCRSFLPLCRRHIFRSVTLNRPYSNFPRLQHARALFASNPALAQCVQKLDYCVSPEDFSSEDFVPALRYFTNVQSLDLWYHGIDQLDWHRLPWHAHKALLRLLYLPTLVSLRLRNIGGIPIADLVPCTNLSHLSIDNVEPLISPAITHVQSEVQKTTLPRPSIRIQDYTVGVHSAIWTNAMLYSTRPDGAPVFDFACLRRLKADCDNEDELVVVHSLLTRTNCLEVIHLKISEVLSLHRLARSLQPSTVERALRSMSFAMYINDDSEDPLAGLCEELEDIRVLARAGHAPAPLQTLALHVMVLPDANCKRGHEWGKLDAVLARPGWAALRRVSLRVTIWDFMRVSSDILKYTLEMLLDTQFVGLARNEDIEFEFKVEVKELMQK